MFRLDGRKYFTSDTHFGHANIIRYCNRPYKTASQMDDDIIKTWNKTVGKDDWVIHLGDFSFTPDRYVHSLNGKIILVRGNHDNSKYNGLFEAVVEGLPVRIGEFDCYLTHIPIDPSNQYKKGREPDFSILNRYDFVICGHTHVDKNNIVSGKNINVGVDAWDMAPVSVCRIIKLMRSLSG